MITGHVHAVPVPLDHAASSRPAAVPARGNVEDRRDLDPAPPAHRPATPSAVPPERELGGPGLDSGPAWRDPETAAPGTAACGPPGRDVVLPPRRPPPPLARQVLARKALPAGDPPEHHCPVPPASP